MFDPEDTLEITVEGVGKFKARLLTERKLKAFNRRVEEKVNGDLERHHASLNTALGEVLIDADLESLTLAQKMKLASEVPWAITGAELDRLKKAQASPSESQTNSSAEAASPENAPAK